MHSPNTFMAFGTVFPVISTPQQRTSLAQLPAMRKFCCIVSGLNSMQDIVSSGGSDTSKSFIGLDLLGAANEDAAPVLNMVIGRFRKNAANEPTSL